MAMSSRKAGAATEHTLVCGIVRTILDDISRGAVCRGYALCQGFFPAIATRFRQQGRDWRSLLTIPGMSIDYR